MPAISAVILSLSLGPLLFAAQPESDIVARISATKTTLKLGQVPKIKVRLHNKSGKEITLVGSLDGSSSKDRYPHAWFEVTGPDGKSAVKEVPRCGMYNRLAAKDFTRVPLGKSFDPYKKGFFPAVQLSPQTFDRPGKYKIRFRYSTAEPAIQKWLGSWTPADEPKRAELVELFKRLPKTNVRSNEITVQIVR